VSAETEKLDEDFRHVRCPHCESGEITLVSLFGSSVSEVMFRCRDCHTFFNWVKWQGHLPASPALDERDDEKRATAAPPAGRQ
jgi:Zn finger protein HypA/HybF involved in hydrogenase expression